MAVEGTGASDRILTPPGRMSPGERIAVALVLGLFIACGIHNIRNLAYSGQDFGVHADFAVQIRDNPGRWFRMDVTNRPFVYWAGAFGLWLFRQEGPPAYALASALLLLFNAAALGLMHDTTRRFLRSPVLRVSALLMLALLPATQIAAVVFAGDAAAPFPFALLCWSLLRMLETDTRAAFARWAGMAGLALCLGNLGKFTFIVLPAGMLVLLFYLWRRLDAGRRRIYLAAAVGVPVAFSGWLMLRSQQEIAGEPQRHHFTWRGSGQFTARTLFSLKASDARIFDAPGYFDFEPLPGNQKDMLLLRPDDYSYPALMHLALFTDVLDDANQGVHYEGVHRRPQPQKAFSQWAVRLGLIFSVPAVLAVLAFVWRASADAFTGARTLAPGALIWGVLGLNWYAPLAGVLYFLAGALDWGYWLPRLLIPAVWAFGLLLFKAIDDRFGSSRAVPAAVAACCTIQTCLHVCSTWY